MKRIFYFVLVSAMVLSFSSVASATVMGVGARSSAMGGVGIATANDITAAYYNPACLSNAGAFDLKLSGGYAMNDLEVLLSALNAAGDPITFVENFYDKKIDAHGALSGIAGLQVGKTIGVSAIPSAIVRANKEADTVNSTFIAKGGYTGIVTFAQEIDIPGLPFSSISIGGNIKAVNDANGYANIPSSSPPSPVTTESTFNVGTGMGFDLGATGKVDIPGLSTLTVGVVLRDVLETIGYKDKTATYQVSTTPPNEGEATLLSESETDRSYIAPMTIGMGAGLTLPGIGTLLAADMNMVGGDDGDATMRFGFEQPVIGIFAVRGGWSTGASSSISYGAGIRAGATFDFAYVVDSKDSRANALVFELGAQI